MEEKRRSKRIAQMITIQVIGMQQGGSSAVGQTAETIEVNNNGALLKTRSKFDPGVEVMIHNPKNLENGLFNIVWSKPSPAGTAWNVAVEYMDGDATAFWGIQ
ncbi:MAG: PilZ domain-containing protein [Acidobacteria bacterium]|nr:PilZ domain-containing protein [Acidobacteriota bacterium]